MTQVMYFDAFSGAAGDMVLGALLDAGLPLERLREALGTLGVEHELRVTRVLRAGISATHVQVVESQSHGHDAHAHTHADAPSSSHDHHHHDHDHGHRNHDHGHHHHDHGHKHDVAQPAAGPHTHHHHHDHRSVSEIARLIGQSALSENGKARAVSMFQRLAEAEAAIHEMPVEKVHLHEVGAVDSIIDIVGAVFGLEWFGIDQIIASPLNVGGGTVEMAHGMFPIPAPATLRLLAGIPMYSNGVMTELVTPTGALIISDYAKSYGPMPAMTMERVGYGAGSRDLGKVPNVLRVVIGELSAQETTSPASSAGAVLKVECEIDDMNPQLFGPVTDLLFAAGALDVFLTPIVMKKGRPGTLLTVLTPLDGRETISRVLFRETTTIGVRFEAVKRETLDREWVEVTVEAKSVRIKVARRNGEVMNAAPEFDDCLRVSTSTGRPIKQVQADAMRAWLELSPTPKGR